jgi:hypothetical protein
MAPSQATNRLFDGLGIRGIETLLGKIRRISRRGAQGVYSKGMKRIATAIAGTVLSVALAALPSCTPVQNPYTNNGVATSPVGNSNSFDPSPKRVTPSSAGTVAGGTIDSPQSEALSDYLKHHQLPLVGAQVVGGSAGKQVILFGFVASDYGKTDAEQKARNYLKDPTIVVDNRIKVSPELAGGKGGSSSGGASATSPDNSNDPYASGAGSAGSVQDYENNMPPDAQAYQQQQQYQQYGGATGSSGMLTTVIPLLGLLGGFSGGSGGFGGSFGGFSSGYAPGYGTYGYPTYPPPMPNSGWGSSYPYP